MADEITVSVSLQASNGYEVANSASGQFDQSAAAYVSGTPSIGTGVGGEALPMGDVSTAGWAFLRNLDATNFVEIGIDSSGFVPFLKLKPGESVVVRLGVNAPYARADTGACVLQYTILAD